MDMALSMAADVYSDLAVELAGSCGLASGVSVLTRYQFSPYMAIYGLNL